MPARTRFARLLHWSLVIGPWALSLASAQPAQPAPPPHADLSALLARPIIAPTLPLAEVRAYTASRVPAMPALTDVHGHVAQQLIA